MVTSFYTMKVNKKRINMEEYYSGLVQNKDSVVCEDFRSKTKCRVCLQNGDIPVASVSKPHDFEEALNVFADMVFDDEESATYLCYVCYKFLKSAILFRKVAQQTNEILKQPFTKCSPDHFQDFLDYDYLDTFKEVKKSKIQCKSVPIRGLKRERKPREVNTKVQCSICKKLMNKTYYFKTHLKLHNPDLPEPYVCDICGKSFKIKNVMNNHRRRHETGHIFKCQFCPYTAKYKDYVKRHMPIHSGEMKYLCTECPARYVSKSSLSDHIQFKHTEPQHKCDSCHKAFHNSLTLQRHIEAVHLRIKKHECNICGMAFGYRHHMLKHQRIVHKRVVLRHCFNNIKLKTVNNNSE